MQPRALIPPSLTYEQWFLKPYIQDLTVSAPLDWNNTAIHVATLAPLDDFAAVPYVSDDVLSIVLEGKARTQAHVGRQYFEFHATPGNIAISPRGTIQSDSRWDASIKVLFVPISRQRLVSTAATTLKDDLETVEISLQLGIHDLTLFQLGFMLCKELQHNGMFGSLYADGIENLLLLHLLANYSSIATLPKVDKGKLTTAQQGIVNDYIQANLHQKISLYDLAKCIHIAVPHFERMFRATFGCPPYRYVLQSRIERAKTLLCYTQKSLYDVAHNCGFANQSHFTRHFTKFVGMPPGQFRYSVRSGE
jgi:AraC family transcriptional regulator